MADLFYFRSRTGETCHVNREEGSESYGALRAWVIRSPQCQLSTNDIVTLKTFTQLLGRQDRVKLFEMTNKDIVIRLLWTCVIWNGISVTSGKIST